VAEFCVPMRKGAILILFFALVVSSCAVGDFKEYSGQQQNWPVSKGVFVKNEYVLPVYYGYPPRPYRVIGYLDVKTARIRHNGVISFAARRAKELGADAIIAGPNISEDQQPDPNLPSFGGVTPKTDIAWFGRGSVVLVKWLR